MSNELIKAKKALAKKILKTFGIELSVAGCGCCDSPNFNLSFNGQHIISSDGKSFEFDTNQDYGQNEKENS